MSYFACLVIRAKQWHYDKQSHYKEVAQGDIFVKQKMRFGLVLGQLAILKKKVWADYEQLLRTISSCFRVQKFLKIFF